MNPKQVKLSELPPSFRLWMWHLPNLDESKLSPNWLHHWKHCYVKTTQKKKYICLKSFHGIPRRDTSPLFKILIMCWCGRGWKEKAQLVTLIGSYLKCAEGICSEILYSWECVLSSDKPPLHGFAILSWASNRTVRLNNLGMVGEQ